MLSIVNNTSLTFKRLPYSMCSGYIINAITMVDGKRTAIKVDEISNPKVPNLVSERMTLKYNELRKWELPDEVVASASDGIKVYINNVQITTNSYTYSPNIKMLYFNKSSNIDANTLIEIEYNTDKVLYVCKTDINSEFEVVPIYQETFRVGQHTIL
jgi:hypothetical protein